MSRAGALLAALGALTVAPALADAERDPWQAGTTPRTYARPGGRVRVHYVTTSVDAVPPADADTSGVPDFVEEVALRGDESLAKYAALGFRAPLTDGALGGDDRLDLYLRDLAGADGSFAPDTCSDTPFTCSGYVTMENDFAGYNYPSLSLAIRILTSHELFHAVQEAYDSDQPIAWSEGTAVWAEEVVYPEQSDFENLVAAFQAKPFRPFDRAGAGFGDLYPYGAALWPYFLEAHVGAGVVAAAWSRCVDTGSNPAFLTAIDAELTARGRTLADEWVEFTRWNALTGRFADGTGYPDAGRLAVALRESPLIAPAAATVIVEGLSARYLPVVGVSEPSRLEVDAMRPVAITVRATAGAPTITRVTADGVAATHTFDITPGAASASLEVIVTSATRGAIQQEVTVAIAPYTPPPPPAADGGGCSASSRPAGGLALLAAAALLAPRRRRR